MCNRACALFHLMVMFIDVSVTFSDFYHKNASNLVSRSQTIPPRHDVISFLYVSRVNKRLFLGYSNYHNVWEKGEVLTLTEPK